jgi:hypothetical protein
MALSFGNIELFRTFEAPNFHLRSDAPSKSVRGFFYALNCYNDIAERRSLLYREGLKTFALGWVRQRCKGDRRSSLSARNDLKPNKSMLQNTKVSPEYAQYTPNADKIKEFFDYCGESTNINETLWSMFQSSICNPELPTETHENTTYAFLYKRLTELLVAIEPPRKMSRIEFNEN